MRRSLSAMIAVLALSGGAAQAAAPLVAPIDQATTISLPRGTRDVLIGNPAIADVNVIDITRAVVVGRSYGVTNLIVIDQLGRTVLERQVVVAAPAGGRVSVIRGGKVDDYACAGGCERAQTEGAGGGKP